MKSRVRNALGPMVLLAALAAAVAGAYLGVERRDRREEARRPLEGLLLAFRPAEVEGVTIEGRGGRVRAVRGPAGWRIVEPRPLEADGAALDALVEAAASLRRLRSLGEAGPADLARYGLSPARVRLALELPAGRRLALEVSAEGGFDGSAYARAGGEVVVVPGGPARALDRGLFELRDRRLLRLDPAEVSRLEVVAPGGAYALERASGGWRLVAPRAERADRGTAEAILAALRDLRAAELVPDPGPDRARGLDRPRDAVRLLLSGGAERRLEVGAAPAGEREAAPAWRWVRVAGEPEIARVEAVSLRALEPGLEALRDRAVLSFDAARVSRVRFEVDGPAIEVVRTAAGPGGEAWAVTTPRAAPVRPYRIPALLRALAGLEATRVAGEGAAAVAAHGLDRPRRTVTLLAEDGTTVVRLEVGAEDAGRAFVRAGGTDRVLEVPRAALAVLPAGPEELEDRPAPGGRPGQGG